MLREEITIHQQLARKTIGSRHPHIVGFERWFETDACLFMVFELVTGGDLHDYLAMNKGPLPVDQCKRIYLQILSAVEYCHLKGVYHRDLKPENILLTDDLNVKLCDFGLATTDEWSSDFEIGTWEYMSPRVLNIDSRFKKSYSCAQADIWSLGVILFTMVTGEVPWEQAERDNPSYAMWLRDREQFRQEFNLSHSMMDILNVAWSLDQSRSVDDIRQEVLKADKFFEADDWRDTKADHDSVDEDWFADMDFSEEIVFENDHATPPVFTPKKLSNPSSPIEICNASKTKGSADFLSPSLTLSDKSWADLLDEEEPMNFQEPLLFTKMDALGKSPHHRQPPFGHDSFQQSALSQSILGKLGKLSMHCAQTTK